MNLILTAKDPTDSKQMGGKAAALARLNTAGFPIPLWFSISPQAFEQSLSEAQRDALSMAGDPAMVQRIVAEIQPSAAVIAMIESGVRDLCSDGQFVAVRSSAVDEDGAGHSFAGQLESFLFVPAEQVVRRVIEVWLSGFTDRVVRCSNRAPR